MKTIFESVIARGDYNLTDLLNKIDSYHVMGRLTDAERDELYAKARAGALDALGYDVKAEIDALWAAVRALQGGANAGNDETEESQAPAKFVQPTGAHDAYNLGDRVTYSGRVYESIINGNVWSPDVYPDGWTEIV